MQITQSSVFTVHCWESWKHIMSSSSEISIWRRRSHYLSHPEKLSAVREFSCCPLKELQLIPLFLIGLLILHGCTDSVCNYVTVTISMVGIINWVEKCLTSCRDNHHLFKRRCFLFFLFLFFCFFPRCLPVIYPSIRPPVFLFFILCGNCEPALDRKVYKSLSVLSVFSFQVPATGPCV